MARLRTTPGSSTKDQRCKLHQLKRRLRMTDEQLHDAIGAASTTALSASAASECITRLGGGKLANKPGEKPSAYKGRAKPGVVRMISRDQAQHIERLTVEYFSNDRERAFAWFTRTFKVYTIRELGTAKRAAEVIATLKGMHTRRQQKEVSRNDQSPITPSEPFPCGAGFQPASSSCGTGPHSEPRP